MRKYIENRFFWQIYSRQKRQGISSYNVLNFNMSQQSFKLKYQIILKVL